MVRMWDRLQIRKAEETVTLVNRTSRHSEIQPSLIARITGTPVARSTVPANFKELQSAVDAGRMQDLDSQGIRQTGAVGTRRRAGPGHRHGAAERQAGQDRAGRQGTDAAAAKTGDGTAAAVPGVRRARTAARGHGEGAGRAGCRGVRKR